MVSSVHLLVIPLVTAFVSWVLFGIALTMPQWIGGVLVLAGIALSSRFRAEDEHGETS